MKKFYRAVSLVVFFLTLFPLFSAKANAAGRLDQFGKIADEYMERVLGEYHVAGAAVSIVKDGQLLFKKGWGYANLEKKTAIDPDTTAFEIASVSKLFTATAAMQMVEAGKLSLKEDVNNYLTAFQIKNPYLKPVTLEQLLTHTAGFDEKIPLYIKSNGEILFDSMEPLEDVLKQNLPPVVREPGTYCQYSVYGMALAGYLVQKVSGRPIDSYITENILKPLQMNESSYGLNSEILPRMSKPYKYQNGAYKEGAYTLISDGPSGSICATASDMAKFMIIQLEGGEYNGVKILNGSTVQNMQAHHYPADSRLTGYGLGFYEAVRNGHRTIEHGGYLPSFSSKLTMLPKENIGMFIAINTDSADSSKVCNEFTDIFYDFFTEHKENADALTAAAGNITLDMDPEKISGSYSFGAFSLRDATKFKSLFVTCGVQCDASGNLTFKSEGLRWNFKYIGGGFFYDQDSGNFCRFTEDNGKTLLHILGGDFEKVPDANKILFWISAASIPYYFIICILVIIEIFRKKNKQKPIPNSISLPLCLLLISYYVLNGVMALLGAAADTFFVINVMMPSIAAVCYASLGLTAVGVIHMMRSWKNTRYGISQKAFFIVLIGLAILSQLFMYTMNGFLL